MNREQELEIELSNIIGRHADWLTGDDWERITDGAGRAYFWELAEQGVLGDKFATALNKAMHEAQRLGQIGPDAEPKTHMDGSLV